MADRKQMISAIKNILIPSLKSGGFSGSFPHYRRRTTDFYDLVTFEFDKYGGGFVIEIARRNTLPLATEQISSIAVSHGQRL
jgi:hypothetical protein